MGYGLAVLAQTKQREPSGNNCLFYLLFQITYTSAEALVLSWNNVVLVCVCFCSPSDEKDNAECIGIAGRDQIASCLCSLLIV